MMGLSQIPEMEPGTIIRPIEGSGRAEGRRGVSRASVSRTDCYPCTVPDPLGLVLHPNDSARLDSQAVQGGHR